MRSHAKNRSQKCHQTPQKLPQRIKHLWNGRPGTLLQKPLCTADPQISCCFLIQILLFWCLICVYVQKYKDIQVKPIQVKFKVDFAVR